MIRKSKAPDSGLFLPFLLLVSLLAGQAAAGPAADLSAVKRVIDGDTLLLDGDERVRLIGVDTPEVHESDKLHADARRKKTDVETIRALGRRAIEFTTKLVLGKRVRLDFDPANAHAKHRDLYGRLLAYVFLEDGTLVNAEIVKQGYGNAYTKYPFGRMDEFRRYESEAREKGRGLWADDAFRQEPQARPQEAKAPGKGRLPAAGKDRMVAVTPTGKKYHREDCGLLGKERIRMSVKEAEAAGYTPCAVCKPLD